ncbi:MAG: hypothetical protein JWO28_353 [Hyphomicrobiales bacterium]|jgi:hypothetical protein|nr:hypothetical protein [Hyphomicrobiales bacterium]
MVRAPASGVRGYTMLGKSFLLGAALALGIAPAIAADVAAPKSPASPPPFFFVNDTQISLWYETNAREPGVFNLANPNGVPITKGVVSITHFDVWQYGTNFFNVDFLKSTNKDPTAGNAIGVGDGATEVYGLYRGTLSLNSLSNTKIFTVPGIIKDVSLGFGFDANTKNTTFAPQKRDVVIGPTVSFDVPGVFNVGLYYYKEWNHCGIGPLICTPSVTFKGVPKLEAVYMQPLTFTGLPLKFSGFANFVWPKGLDGFGMIPGSPCCKTKQEFLTQNRLVLDIGQLLMGKPNFVDAFIGWQYWYNKFGNDHRIPANGGSIENQFVFGLSWHAL